ncbi:hypothetical protein BDV26DRAFT_276125 [Aspergillus bertholletiae]|uniref:Uncharacterized protein n=1 Tax=Aspergillus bertholletiae TaxID=1226010 RepID=A0A5N7AQX5_9EURO|nr:hypothetical protein BDV26DRAFT_276125 [Aspergillus bertholletiae]
MAQRTSFRLAQVFQYLYFLEWVKNTKAARFRGSNSICSIGQRTESFTVDSIMKILYTDWDTIDNRVRDERRRKYRRENRQAKRWILVASKLSFGVLLVASKQHREESCLYLRKNSYGLSRSSGQFSTFG